MERTKATCWPRRKTHRRELRSPSNSGWSARKLGRFESTGWSSIRIVAHALDRAASRQQHHFRRLSRPAAVPLLPDPELPRRAVSRWYARQASAAEDRRDAEVPPLL